MNNTILILDGEERSSLAAVRSLGKCGLRILVGSESKTSLAGVSKYCTKQVTYASPYHDRQRFIRDIQNIIKHEKIDVLLPMTDVSVYNTLEHEDELKRHVKIMSCSYEQYVQASNKINLVNLSKKLNIPVPGSIIVETHSDVVLRKNQLQYPLVLKPRASLVSEGNTIYKAGVRIVDTYDEIVKSIENNIVFKHPFMIQEKLNGEGLGVFALCNYGKPVVVFAHRRIREKPPWGGVSVLCESTAPDPQAEYYALSLLKKLNWHGIAMVEFKRDNKTGIPMLMETNARFWGTLQLAIDAGVDFPKLLYQQCIGTLKEEKITYTYSRLRWLLGDLDNLYINLSNKNLNYSFGDKQKLVKNFFKEFSNNSKFQVLGRKDYLPFLWEIKKYFLQILRKS